MKQHSKYVPQYFMPPEPCLDWASKDRIERAPIWCSVDLRDGNQSLITPMTLDEKIRYFKFLVGLGFKEIEVGFPAASETEFTFMRRLIEDGLIPDDVTIQVLTQSRAHIIEKTFESLRGARRAIVHLYNSTSAVQREQVFRRDEDQIVAIADVGARAFNEYAAQMPETEWVFQYSPESFTGTELDYALRICNHVIDIWNPAGGREVIINLPATVEHSMPHIHAQQIEYMHKNLNQREHIKISLHPHNDRGCAVAAAELGILAGADRIEGTLFGNGERTGNVDIITLAGNLYTHGVDPEIDLSDMPRIVRVYEEVNKLPVSPRHPYAGALAFAAFSGSHQDAIAKGMHWREDRGGELWTVPYLPIDPVDVNREYETDIIRINSQSGKGGVTYVLAQNYGYKLPLGFREEMGYFVKDISDREARELSPADIHDAFVAQYVNVRSPLEITAIDWKPEGAGTGADVSFMMGGVAECVHGTGNGSLDAVQAAIRAVCPDLVYTFEDYEQHALEEESNARAASYVRLSDADGKPIWGVGIHCDITTASVNALLSAVNRVMQESEVSA